MMRWLVGVSQQFRYLVVAIAAALVFFGITRLRDMPVDVFPEFSPPTAEIQTEALGLSAAEVESLVTLNTEELLAGVPWLKTTRSQSVPGMSSVQLIFEPGTNLIRARRLRKHGVTQEQIIRTAGDALWVSSLTFLNASVCEGPFIRDFLQGFSALQLRESPDCSFAVSEAASTLATRIVAGVGKRTVCALQKKQSLAETSVPGHGSRRCALVFAFRHSRRVDRREG